MKNGINHAGALVQGVTYARQRMHDALSTPLGSIYFCRSYGSKLHTLIDSNHDNEFYLRVCDEVARVFDDDANGLDDCEFLNVTFENNVMTIHARYQQKEINIDQIYTNTNDS